MARDLLKPLTHQAEEYRFIVYDENGCFLQLHTSSSLCVKGIRNEKQGWPASSVSVSFPPCSSTMVRERLNPKPMPLPTSLVVKNGSMIFVLSSSGTPGPLSMTENTAESSSSVTSR